MTEWVPAPMRVAEASKAEGGEVRDRVVRVYEVGPRDGLQAEAGVVATADKVEFCRRLLAAGVSDLEVTSFVPPAWIPQLADAEDVLADLAAGEGSAGDGAAGAARLVAFVSNSRGVERALGAGIREVSTVASVTESFAAANLNTDVAGSLERVNAVVAAAGPDVPVRGYLSMCFGDPWEGHVEPERVAELAARLHASGCRTIALSDTIGTGTPGHVVRVVELAVAAGVPRSALALHLHDTYGQALASVHAALDAGVREFDSSAGGLGRCPFAPGAAGNLATEDLVWMLEGLGLESGIDLQELIRTSLWMGERLGRLAPSRVVRAFAARQ